VSPIPLNFKVVIALLLTMAGIGLLLRRVWLLLSAFESRSWSQVPGIVLTSKLNTKSDVEGGACTKRESNTSLRLKDSILLAAVLSSAIQTKRAGVSSHGEQLRDTRLA
jgi:hypothetical protein